MYIHINKYTSHSSAAELRMLLQGSRDNFRKRKPKKTSDPNLPN